MKQSFVGQQFSRCFPIEIGLCSIGKMWSQCPSCSGVRTQYFQVKNIISKKYIMYTWFLNFDPPPNGITYFIVSRLCLEISQKKFTELNRESYKYSSFSHADYISAELESRIQENTWTALFLTCAKPVKLTTVVPKCGGCVTRPV